MIRSTRRLTLAATAAIASLAIGASAAQAAVTINTTMPGTGNPVTVTAHVPTLAPNPATHYAIAECNTTTGGPATWAERCNATAGNRFIAPTDITATTFDRSITVDRTFTNFNFAGGHSTGSTMCRAFLGSTQQCSVVVSWYYLSGGNPVFITGEKADITF